MMLKKGFAVLALLAFWGSTARAQDARKVVEDVGREIGAANLNSISYSGTGYAYFVLQNYRPFDPWPKFYLKYSRTVDYQKGLSREEMIRTQAMDPPRGGGQQPIYSEARQTPTVGENSPWSGNAVELTPYGWVKAAMASNPTMRGGTLNGKPVTVISFTARGKYKLEAYVDKQNLLDKIETWTSQSMLGDMPIETTFSDYRDFGGVKFPMKIEQKQGGFPVLDLNVSEVQPNAPANVELPQRRQAGGPTVEAKKIADGVWYLDGSGGDANAVAVEFKDFVAMIESSVSEQRALENIAAVKKVIPDKPIRYNINSHAHGDHAGGLRTYVAEGATIITQEGNKRYYDQVVLKNPHTLEPDLLAKNPKPAKFILVKDKYVLTDGNRSLEIYWIKDNGHASTLLMSYLPKEKMLIETDLFNQFPGRRPNTPPPGIVSPYTAALGDNLKRLKLDVQQIAVIHGNGVAPVEALNKELEGTVQNPTVRPAD
jgi:glyoxylase-like metal-dependent hydrolase (beta-lactamase superfamily II)